MAKRSSNPQVAYPKVIAQVRDLVRVVGIVAPFAPLGMGTWGRHWKARQTSGTVPCGDCRRVLWVSGLRGQYSGKISFIEKPCTRLGVAMWLNVGSLPRSQSSGT